MDSGNPEVNQTFMKSNVFYSFSSPKPEAGWQFGWWGGERISEGWKVLLNRDLTVKTETLQGWVGGGHFQLEPASGTSQSMMVKCQGTPLAFFPQPPGW